MSHPPADSPPVVITQNPPCANCDYNLRGLAEDSRCPECGKEIAWTLQLQAAFPLDRRPPIAGGMITIAISNLAPVATLIMMLLATRAGAEDGVTFVLVGGLIVEHVVRCLSVLRMTQAMFMPSSMPDRTRLILRAANACECGSIVLIILLMWWTSSQIRAEEIVDVLIILVAAVAAYILSRSFFAFFQGRFVDEIIESTGQAATLGKATGRISLGLGLAFAAVICGDAIIELSNHRPDPSIASVLWTLTSTFQWLSCLAILWNSIFLIRSAIRLRRRSLDLGGT